MSETAEQQQQQQHEKVPAGSVAAAVARGCIGKPKEECTAEFAYSLVQQKFNLSAAAAEELQQLRQLAERVVKEVVCPASSAEEIEAFAAKAMNQKHPFDEVAGGGGDSCIPVAAKAELQAAVKALGMGPAAYRGLSKDDPDAYCKELQSRVLSFIENNLGESWKSLPPPDKLDELKLAAEARKELSSLDASNIIEGRPRRRAASSAAEAIRRDLEREAAQAASLPQSKRMKTKGEALEAGGAAARSGKNSSSSSSSSSSSNNNNIINSNGAGDSKEQEEEEDDDDDDEEEEEDDDEEEKDDDDDDDDDDDSSSTGDSEDAGDDEEGEEEEGEGEGGDGGDGGE
ncbi:hypothetical protein, conserved [Eimeria maxima]|uniref:Histone chaperone domain-containing protein n=1 Tax=Eimeria maxima TaxID=5804 RepID=U6MFV6_EIMMA|nr:hypothetical protein, conserved [Eimeria maxima]CDJ61943.1 hypothetical protein, conserved [Eimeria maxima]